MTPIVDQPNLFWIYSRLILVPLIWGGTFIAGRISSGQLPPSVSAFSRYLIATVCLAFLWWWLEGRKPTSARLFDLNRNQCLAVIGLGATGIFLYNVFFFAALRDTPASRTAIFVALNPVVTIVLSVFIYGERLVLSRWIGVALALFGVWWVVTHGDFSQLMAGFGPGERMMLVAVSSWAFYTLIGRWVLKTLSPLRSTFLASLTGTLFLFVYAAPELLSSRAEQFTGPVIWSLLFLGVLGTAVAFVWYYQGVQMLGSSRTVIFNNLVPIFGVLLGWLLLSEQLPVSLLMGGSVAVLGIFLVNRQPPTPASSDTRD